MAISADAVKALREETGAGVLDCKRALEQVNGDVSKAKRVLKEMGLATVGQKRMRTTEVGRIFTATQSTRFSMIELRCESDFVARNTHFIDLGKKISMALLNGAPEGDAVEAPLSAQITALIEDAIGVIKENIRMSRHLVWHQGTNQIIRHYLHGDVGSLASVVKASHNNVSDDQCPVLEEMVFNVAMHVAAYKPLYLSKENIDAAYIKEQEAIFKTQTLKLNKPDSIVDGIVKGKLNKHLKEICLLTQPFLKDESKSVAQYIETAPPGSGLIIDDYKVIVAGEAHNE